MRRGTGKFPGIISALFVVTIVWTSAPCHAYTEVFYVCQGGNGSEPKLGWCGMMGTCWDADDFSNAANWSTFDVHDGRIGPNDLVLLLDDCGPLTRDRGRGVLEIQGSGLEGRPITIRGELDGNTLIRGEGARECVSSLNQSYLTLGDLECVGGEPFGIMIWSGNYVTIEDCKSHDSRRATIFLAGTHGLIRRCELYGSKGEHGLYFSEDFTRDGVVEYSYIHDNDSSGIQYNSNAITQTGMICRYNWIENNREQDINNLAMEGGKIYGNIFVNKLENAYHAIFTGDDGPGQEPRGTQIYNNTFYGLWAETVAFADNSTGHFFYNNIIHNLDSKSRFIGVYPGSSAALDHNQYHPENLKNGWHLSDSTYNTLNAWRSALGGCPGVGNDCHSATSDPMFFDPQTNDFTLRESSPCISKGTDSIGTQFEEILEPSSSKQDFGPRGFVSLGNQSDYGIDWEIGAYVFGQRPPSPPSGLRINPQE